MGNPKTRKEVERRLKSARIKKKMVQAEVAKKVDLNTNYYACIERGEVNASLWINSGKHF